MSRPSPASSGSIAGSGAPAHPGAIKHLPPPASPIHLHPDRLFQHAMMHLFGRYLPTFFLAFLCATVILPIVVPDGGTMLFAQKATKKTKSKSKPAGKPERTGTTLKQGKKGTKQSRSTKQARTAKPSQRKRDRITGHAAVAIAPRHQILPDSTVMVEIAQGVSHRWITTVGKQVVNVLAVDLKSGARIRSFKAHERYDGLQNASDIAYMAGSILKDTVLAATNASFWRAGFNSPIGATIVDGEVVEMPGYKQWSSLLVYDDGTAGIDRITLRGEIFWRHRRRPVEGVNRRARDENGIVVYNRYYGDSLPRGSRKNDSAIIAEAFANKVGADIGDDTEGEGIDTAALIRSYRESKVLEDREHPGLKIACVPLRPRHKRDPILPPRIDDTMRLMVVAVDTGVVAMPPNGYVFSLGDAAEWFTVVQPGDTISLLYSISPRQAKPVRDVLTGTPRIVRDGKAGPEQEIEGSKARRFVDGKLSRTAVGISRNGDSLFLVTVNSPSSSQQTTGMSLWQLAAFMESIGAYQALNFDGGGSASMSIQGTMISRQGQSPTSRRVSNAVLVVRPFQEKQARRKTVARPSPGTQAEKNEP